jgi:hypothetical protein
MCFGIISTALNHPIIDVNFILPNEQTFKQAKKVFVYKFKFYLL